jgi:predicted O-methyltransferase YrrM
MGANAMSHAETIQSCMFDFKDFYRSIVRQMPKGAVMAEVGVADGASAIFLAEVMQETGKKFRLYLIDSLAYGGSDQLQTIVRNVLLSELPSKRIEIVPKDSLNASCQFPDGHFDFVFIDASHRYEETKADIRLWYRKIKEDGILAGHDYHHSPEVKQAVDEVLPRTIVRAPLADGRIFEPENFLHTANTAKDFGVWWVQKKFYIPTP